VYTGGGSIAVVVAIVLVATLLILIVFRDRPSQAVRQPGGPRPDEDEPTSFDEWATPSQEQRLEVSRLARQGLAHPDPEVGRIARRWAGTIVDAYESESGLSRWIFQVVARVFGLIDGSAFYDEIPSTEWLEYRWAQRVLAATAGSGTVRAG
jgi:hypothetical protein